MSRNYLVVLLAGVSVLGSCSTAYRSGQTPDDVYYSPAKERPAYVEVPRENNNGYYNNNSNQSNYNSDNYQSYDDYVSDYRSDRFMRLSMLSPLRLSIYDDFYWNDLRYNNYNYYSYSAWNNPWNGYYYWNSFYNPYSIGYSSPFGYGYGGYGGYYGGGYGGGKTVSTYANARSTFNPAGYLNHNFSNNNRYINSDNARGRNAANNGFQGSNIGRYFSGTNNTNSNNNNRVRTYNYNNSNNNNTYRNNNNNNNNYTAPQRSYTPAPSSNSSSSGSSSGSSGGGGRPHRGG